MLVIACGGEDKPCCEGEDPKCSAVSAAVVPDINVRVSWGPCVCKTQITETECDWIELVLIAKGQGSDTAETWDAMNTVLVCLASE